MPALPIVSDASGTVVFVHAHPDDEAIFTGGTMLRLAERGVRVILVVATGGELGTVRPGYDESFDSAALARLRRDECSTAATLLGVDTVEFLGYHDSGMAGEPSNEAPGAFAAAPANEAAERLAAVAGAHRLSALVGYDAAGIYAHPDHIKVAQVVEAAAQLAGVPTVYGATVDREYLHFVETHVVAEAALIDDLGLVRSHLGVATVEVDVTVDVRSVLDRKRAAIAAHASQIPETASVLQLPDHHFADVYGWEWFVRQGPPGPLDELT